MNKRVLILCLLLLVASCTQKKAIEENDGFIKLGWKELQGMDYRTGKVSDTLKNANGKLVKIAGFVTPLTDDATDIFEFTLVPYPVSCIHTPPPPPNQIVVVTLVNDRIDPEDLWSPFWIYGTLTIDETQNEFFAASFTMQATRIVKYE